METPSDMLRLAKVEWTRHDATLQEELNLSIRGNAQMIVDATLQMPHELVEEELALKLMRAMGVKRRVTPIWMSSLGIDAADIYTLLLDADSMPGGELRMRKAYNGFDVAIFAD